MFHKQLYCNHPLRIAFARVVAGFELLEGITDHSFDSNPEQSWFELSAPVCLWRKRSLIQNTHEILCSRLSLKKSIHSNCILKFNVITRSSK